jgi:hypothetical protein
MIILIKIFGGILAILGSLLILKAIVEIEDREKDFRRKIRERYFNNDND